MLYCVCMICVACLYVPLNDCCMIRVWLLYDVCVTVVYNLCMIVA